MSPDSLFLDTSYVQALLNRRDQYHAVATRFQKRAREALEVWITEAVLIEIGNALSIPNRTGADAFIRQCYTAPNIRVARLDTDLLLRGLDLYRDRPDKEWSLVDCISFVVMQDNGLTEALTTDAHFRQAGFTPLLRDDAR